MMLITVTFQVQGRITLMKTLSVEDGRFHLIDMENSALHVDMQAKQFASIHYANLPEGVNLN